MRVSLCVSVLFFMGFQGCVTPQQPAAKERLNQVSSSRVTSFEEARNSIVLGDYQVYGYNLNGLPYRGKVTIQANKAGSYKIRWLIGDSVHEGVAMITRNNLLLHSTWQVQGDDDVNEVDYQICHDGVLLGFWGLGGREVLVPER